jgi:hypothetical protein
LGVEEGEGEGEGEEGGDNEPTDNEIDRVIMLVLLCTVSMTCDSLD